MRIENVTMKNY